MKRSDLKVVISSATVDAELFCDYFTLNKGEDGDKPAILSVEGRMHPLEIYYTEEAVPDFVKSSVHAVMKIHREERPAGDILVFLTGQDEVESVCMLLQEEVRSMSEKLDKLWILPMYGALPHKEQVKIIFSPIFFVLNSFEIIFACSFLLKVRILVESVYAN